MYRRETARQSRAEADYHYNKCEGPRVLNPEPRTRKMSTSDGEYRTKTVEKR